LSPAFVTIKQNHNCYLFRNTDVLFAGHQRDPAWSSNVALLNTLPTARPGKLLQICHKTARWQYEAPAQWSYAAILLATGAAATILDRDEVVYTGLAHRQ
jgi:hypothetical protein